MFFIKIRSLLLIVVIGLSVVFTMLEFFGIAAPVAAREEVTASSVQMAPNAKLTDGLFIEITADTPVLDLDGNLVDNGTYAGRVKCNGDNCSQRMSLYLQGTELGTLYEYKFSTMQALEFGYAVVAGTGIMTRDRQKVRFSFTAVFDDNLDGTVWSSFQASDPRASFVIPGADGTFEIR